MKKRITALVLFLVMLFSLNISVMAVDKVTVEGIYKDGYVTIKGDLPAGEYAMFRILDTGSKSELLGAHEKVTVTADSTLNAQNVTINTGSLVNAENRYRILINLSDGTLAADGYVVFEKEYNITIAPTANGTVTTAPADKAEEGVLVTINTVPADGYEVDTIAVTNDEDGSEVDVIDDQFTMPESDVTVTVTFRVQPTYTVTVKINGEETPVSVKGSRYTLPTAPADSVAPAGKVFKAWLVNGAEEQPGTVITLTEDITIEAVWEDKPVTPPAITYTVSFSANGGSGSMSAQSGLASGKTITLPACGFTAPAGKEFDAWEINGTRYAAGASYTVRGNVTVKALWKDIGTKTPVTVTFDANGGTISGSSTMTTGADGKLSSLPSATRSGYTFDGWYTAASGGSKITTSTVFDANTTVYAQWTRSGGSSGGSGGGGGGGGSASSISINSTSHGTVTASPKNTGKGGKVTLTVKPSTGYVLDTITVKDTSGKEVELTKISDTKYTFIMPASRVTVDAKFVSDGSQPQQPSTTQTFYDVSASHWANTEISWALANGIMNGTGNGMFSPDNRVTRQQTWMVLGRMAGASPADMAAAKAWAVSNGISDGTNPGNSLTRQQLVALLYRYAQLKGYATTGGADISTYPDNASVADYAKEAMAWAVGNGIVAGTSDGRLNPTGTATRAQFAVIMYRFSQKIAG